MLPVFAHFRPVQTQDFKRRGSYKCSKCGKTKRGHRCDASHPLVSIAPTHTVQDASASKAKEYLDQNITDLATALELLQRENEILRGKLRHYLPKLSSHHHKMCIDRDGFFKSTSLQPHVIEPPYSPHPSHRPRSTADFALDMALFSPHLPPIVSPEFFWPGEESGDDF
jgi:hypothetical protein